MKMSAKNYNVLLESARDLNARSPLAMSLLRQELAANPKVKDVEKRFRWDLIRLCAPPRWVCEQLYDVDGLDDTHIDTALRNIVKELGI